MATLTASLHQFASNMQAEGQGTVLDQFGNLANPLAHYQGTGPEIWQQTKGKVTHFVSSMGTTGTIMGTSRFLKDQKPDVRIIGLQPKEGSAIAGIRRWPKEYLPTIFQVILGCIHSASALFMCSTGCTCCAHEIHAGNDSDLC